MWLVDLFKRCDWSELMGACKQIQESINSDEFRRVDTTCAILRSIRKNKMHGRDLSTMVCGTPSRTANDQEFGHMVGNDTGPETGNLKWDNHELIRAMRRKRLAETLNGDSSYLQTSQPDEASGGGTACTQQVFLEGKISRITAGLLCQMKAASHDKIVPGTASGNSLPISSGFTPIGMQP